MPERLFPIDDEARRDDSSHPYLVIGALSELRAAELLIERGHRVAKPVVDDFGIDLVVNYHRERPTTVQVKCSRHLSTAAGLKSRGWQFRPISDPVTADLVMFHARPADIWWIVPRGEIVLNKGIRIFESRLRAVRSDAIHVFDEWRDRWDLFEEATGV